MPLFEIRQKRLGEYAPFLNSNRPVEGKNYHSGKFTTIICLATARFESRRTVDGTPPPGFPYGGDLIFPNDLARAMVLSEKCAGQFPIQVAWNRMKTSWTVFIVFRLRLGRGELLLH